jgi:hypothetical protein
VYKPPADESTEQTRTFTRGAVDPLLCFRGVDPTRIVPPSSASPAELAQRLAAARPDGPPDDRVYLDPLDDPAVLAAMKAVDDGDGDGGQSGVAAGADAHAHARPGHGGGDGEGEGERAARRRQTLSAEPDAVLVSAPRATPSAALDRERLWAARLDTLCPPLAATPRLQDKAVRAVLSVGVEVLVVDAASSAAMGPLRVAPGDLVTSDQTDALFGAFSVTPP